MAITQLNIDFRGAGFTLIEMVVTILISSIMAIGVVSFIGDSVTGIISAGNRNQISSSGRTVVDRLALELHNALPNSIRVWPAPNVPLDSAGDQCLEFIPFLGATSYINPPFTGLGGDEFDVVSFNPSLPVGSATNLHAVIYPINRIDLYKTPVANPPGPPAGPTSGPRALISNVSAVNSGVVTLTLSADHRYSRRSPVDRIYVTNTPVSFCITGGRLFRYKNYGFQENQLSPAGLSANAANRVLISDSVANGSLLRAFVLFEATLRRNAIVSLDFNFVENLDTVRLKHEVQIRNVP